MHRKKAEQPDRGGRLLLQFLELNAGEEETEYDEQAPTAGSSAMGDSGKRRRVWQYEDADGVDTDGPRPPAPTNPAPTAGASATGDSGKQLRILSGRDNKWRRVRQFEDADDVDTDGPHPPAPTNPPPAPTADASAMRDPGEESTDDEQPPTAGPRPPVPTNPTLAPTAELVRVEEPMTGWGNIEDQMEESENWVSGERRVNI